MPVVMVLAIVWQFRAPLLGRVFWFEDIAGFMEPHWIAAARQMRGGYAGSWEPGAWSGFPLIGDPQVGFFYPLQWLWLLVHPLRVYAWLALLHPLIGAAGMFRLARERGRSIEAATVAGLALGLGAFMILELRHAMFMATTAWLPWVLVAVETSQRRWWPSVLGGGLALGLTVLSGGWSMLLYGGVVVGVYALTTGRAKTALVGIGVFGLGLSAVQIFPALSHLGLSPRGLGVDYAFASSFAWPSWSYLSTVVLPTVFGDGDSYRGASNQWELCGYGIGLVGSLLALLSLHKREGRRQRLLFFALLAVAAGLARGGDAFLHPLLFKVLPVAVRCPARALYVWVLAAPILAADGVDVVIGWQRPAWRRPAGLVVVGLVIVELLVTWRGENPSLRFADTRVHPTVSTQLRANPGRYINDVHLDHRLHNSGMAWGAESAGGYSSLPIWRYLHLLWIANHGTPYPHARLADDLTAQGLWRFDSPIVDLLSVKWLLAPRELPPAGTGWTRVSMGGDLIDLWRNDEAGPRAFVVHQQQVIPDEAGQARAMGAADFAPLLSVVVDHAVPGVPLVGSRPPSLVQALDRESPLSLAIGVQLDAPGILVLAEPWSPWWQVVVDGRPAENMRVDYALRGVGLSKGPHTIAFTYEDEPFFYGVTLTCTTALIMLLVVGVAWRRRSWTT